MQSSWAGPRPRRQPSLKAAQARCKWQWRRPVMVLPRPVVEQSGLYDCTTTVRVELTAGRTWRLNFMDMCGKPPSRLMPTTSSRRRTVSGEGLYRSPHFPLSGPPSGREVITQLSPATSSFIGEELLGNAARFAEASMRKARHSRLPQRSFLKFCVWSVDAYKCMR